MEIDIELLRKDLKEYFEGAFLAGGFGAALMEMSDVEIASPEELVNIALRLNVDLSNYQVGRRR